MTQKIDDDEDPSNISYLFDVIQDFFFFQSKMRKKLPSRCPPQKYGLAGFVAHPSISFWHYLYFSGWTPILTLAERNTFCLKKTSNRTQLD
jgi:hypothetical protein